MKRFPVPIVSMLLLVLLAGCGSKKVMLKSESEVEVPDWYLSPPTSEEYLYGVGTADSKMLKVAISRAEMDAKGNIAARINSKIERLKKDFIESIGLGEEEELVGQFTYVQKEIVSMELAGVTTEAKSIKKKKDIYTVYVLMSYPYGDAASKFMNSMSKNKRLYTEFKASKAYKELDKAIKEYEKKRDY
jgi:hypothetical protein